jgi:hypothetical protein
MPMRADCRHYESRTYASGEVVRKCRLDLAPDAPWRCPDDCPQFARRTMDIGWQYGSLTSAVAAPEPEPAAPDNANAAALLDEAEDIINSAAPGIMAEFAPKKKRLGRNKNKNKKKRK